MNWTDPDKTREAAQGNNPVFTYDDLVAADNLQQQQEQTIEQPAVQRPKKKTAQEYIDEITNRELPKPYYDSNRPEELKRLARNNALAKGFSLIGDMVNLSKNAKVKKRQPDHMEAKYMNDFFQYLDKYGNAVDAWNAQNTARKDRTNQMQAGQANMDEQVRMEQGRLEEMQRRSAYDYELGKQKLEYDNLWKQIEQGNKDRDYDLDVAKAKVDERYKNMTLAERQNYHDKMALASMIRAQRTGSGSGGGDSGYVIYDNDGNKINLDANERDKVFALILADPNTQLTTEELDLLNPKLGQPVSTNAINNIVQKYALQKQLSSEYLNKKYRNGGNTQEPETTQQWLGTQERPAYPGAPLRIEGQQQKQEYSTGGYY